MKNQRLQFFSSIPPSDLLTLSRWYPGVDFFGNFLPDDDLHTILYDASWSPVFRIFVTDRNSVTGRLVTGLYEGATIESATKTGVVFDNTDTYCRPGTVFIDPLVSNRIVMFYFGPNGTTNEQVGVALWNESIKEFDTDLGFKLQPGIGIVPSDIQRIFPLECHVVGSYYYLLCLESTTVNDISRMVWYRTNDTTFNTSWERLGIVLENGTGWNAQNTAQGHFYFDVAQDRWVLYFMGANATDDVRKIGAAYSPVKGIGGLTAFPYVRSVINPLLKEVISQNPGETQTSYIGIPIFYDDPVAGRLRMFYRSYQYDYTNGDNDWRCKEASLSSPGLTWWKIKHNLRTGSLPIVELTNQTYRYRTGATAAFTRTLRENLPQCYAIRAQIDPGGKINSRSQAVAFLDANAAPSSSTGVYYMNIRNVDPYNEIRIVENGSVTDITPGSGVSDGDFMMIRQRDDNGNLLSNLQYYLNDTLIHTGAAISAARYPCIFNNALNADLSLFNVRVLVDRVAIGL